MASSTAPLVNEMVESILMKEPNYDKYFYEPSSGLAEPPSFVVREWKVPTGADGSAKSFWACAHQLEQIPEVGDAILFVQQKVQDAVTDISTCHAHWLTCNASYARSGPTDPGANTVLQAVQTAQTNLQVAKANYWNWKFLLRGLEGPPPSYAGDLAGQLAAVRAHSDSRIAVVEGEVRTIRTELGEIKELLIAMQGGTRPPIPPVNPNPNPITQASKPIRVPPPKFDGTKEGTKVTTWFEQFDDYSTVMQISPCDLVANAALCLSGRAAEQWALMKKSLVQRGKDPRDFDTFKTEMLSQFVEGKVEHTVRVRLARLKHSGSVASYHAAFRAIMVEAVQHPISGPEACTAFRQGLKPSVYQLVMRDSSAKDEMEHLDVVVKAAKEAEDLLAVIAGSSSSDRDDRKDHKRRLPPMAPTGSKKPAKALSPQEATDKARWVKKGLPEKLWHVRNRDGRCIQCGSKEHTTSGCTAKNVVLPPAKTN